VHAFGVSDVPTVCGERGGGAVGRAIAAGDSEDLGAEARESGPARFGCHVQR
jgi:hypothetical protein